MVYFVIRFAGLIGRLGFYQGAEIVTARAQAYAESKLEIISYACFLILFSPL